MDEDHIIDEKPSIKMKIKTDSNLGNIWLSAVYESHKYDSDIDIPEKKCADFLCPSCNASLVSDLKCEECNSNMVELTLNEGGKVKFCSKESCVNHMIEFNKIDVALKLFYDSSALSNVTDYDKKRFKELEEMLEKKNIVRRERKEVLKHGTFLYTYCPHCKHTLNKDNFLEADVINTNDEKGILHLSPYLNVYNHKSTIHLPEKNDGIKDITCPHCHHTLIEEEKCPDCDRRIAHILVTTSSKLVDFFFCTKPGCKWHGISTEDENTIVLDDSNEW